MLPIPARYLKRRFNTRFELVSIGAEKSSSFRRWPNRKWSTHARCSLRRRWCRVGAGSIPGIGETFGFGTGSRGLAGRHAVKGAAAPTGIVHALDAKGILRYASLGRSRNAIDRPESCCSEQRSERYSDHFCTIFAVGVVFSGALGIDSVGTSQRGHQSARPCSRLLPLLADPIRSSIVCYANSASCRGICKARGPLPDRPHRSRPRHLTA
jgi:hypothetical protein